MNIKYEYFNKYYYFIGIDIFNKYLKVKLKIFFIINNSLFKIIII